MSMRDEKGRFIKRMKDALSGSKPATLEHLIDTLPDRAESAIQEKFMDMNRVSMNVVPKKVAQATVNQVQKSTRRSYTMSATITIIGNLTADPELVTTNNGKSRAKFSLAYTPKRPDGSDGNTSFYNLTAWEYIADNFAASFKKGDRLVVLGRVVQNKYTNAEGNNVSQLDITATEIAGSCRFHTVDMQKIQRKQAELVEVEETEAVSEDIFS